MEFADFSKPVYIQMSLNSAIVLHHRLLPQQQARDAARANTAISAYLHSDLPEANLLTKNSSV